MDCLFCKIANKEIPAEIVWENENFIAFLDINQDDKGHSLVIPKKHFRWVWDLPVGRQACVSSGQGLPNYGAYFEAARIVKKILDEKYQPQFVEMKIWGIDVPHAHIHLIPHY